MPKEKVEDAISRVHALLQAPETAAMTEALRTALASKTNLIAAKAASVIEQRKVTGLMEELVSAYKRFSDGSSDKGCVAKNAIAGALYELGASAESVYLHGVEHVQKEASWGPAVDAAAQLRGTCALALVRIGHREALGRAADLLGDPEVQARIFAARALAYAGHDHAALPIRTKIRIGDDDPEVLAECYIALLKLTPAAGVPIVAKLLDDPDDDTRQNAALALGASRLPAAGDALIAHWRNNIHPHTRQQLALAIATLRTPASLEFLLRAIEEEPASTCVAIIEALRIYAHDESMVAKIRAAVSAKENLAVTQAFEEKYGTP